MADRPIEILLVEDDEDLCDMLGRHLETSLGCRLTIAATASAAMREELTGGHDLLIISAELPDDEDLSLLRELRVTNDAPIIILARQTRVEDVLTALRAGAIDWFEKPFDLADLTTTIRETIESRLQIRTELARARRLRKVARRIIREREDLNARMDLLCRDLVQAYRRLAEKVTASGILN